MKKSLILLFLLFLPNISWAALDDEAYSCRSYYVVASCSNALAYDYTYGSTINSSSHTSVCYNEMGFTLDDDPIVSRRIKVINSITCKSGYTKNAKTWTFCEGSPNPPNGPSSITYYTCGCSDTTTWSGTWSAYQTGVQRQSGERNNCGEKSTVYKYRCAAGYYSANMSSSADTVNELACTACPANATCSSAGATAFSCNAGYYKYLDRCESCTTTCGMGHTSPAGSTSYTQCRANANTTINDITGTFTYTTACCCDGTCDSKCNSGISCQSADDCPNGRSCIGGCCLAATLCASGVFCSTVLDCPTPLTQSCDNGCCVDKGGLGITECKPGDRNYCQTGSDCTGGATCNLLTSCCNTTIIK